MMLKQRVMDPRQKDDISEALAVEQQPEPDNPSGAPYRLVPAYIYHWHPSGADQKALKAQTVGEHSRDLISFTRFYPTLKPKVVIDFEPAPPAKFWEEEKRRFCIERGIVYIPIHLGDTMDESGFQERRRACERLMVASREEGRERDALAAEAEHQMATHRGVEDWLQDAQLMALIDQEAQTTVQGMIDNGRRLTGMARLHVLRKVKADIVTELRKGLRSGRIVDPLGRYQEPAASAQ